MVLTKESLFETARIYLFDVAELYLSNGESLFNKPLTKKESDSLTHFSRGSGINFHSILRNYGPILDMFHLEFNYLGDASAKNPVNMYDYSLDLTVIPFRALEIYLEKFEEYNNLKGYNEFKDEIGDYRLLNRSDVLPNVSLRTYYSISSNVVTNNSYHSVNFFKKIKDSKDILGVGKVDEYMNVLNEDIKKRLYDYNEGYKDIPEDNQENFRDKTLSILTFESILNIFYKKLHKVFKVDDYNKALKTLQNCLIENQNDFEETAMEIAHNTQPYEEPESYSQHLDDAEEFNKELRRSTEN